MDQFTDGVVVKPSQQGSSLGITVVREAAELGPAILDAMSYDDRVLLEAYVPGRELAVTVLGPTEEPRALPTVELFFEGEIYDYTAHYEIGGAQMRPAELEPAIAERVARTATDAYTAAGCRDFARVDIRLRDDVPHVLEINTIPGLTETGPAPLAAELGGFGFDQFIETISERAARD
jgi:D-alanine-D-alanine ligase